MNHDRIRTVLGYIRVSREEQAVSGLGLEAQRTAIEQACQDRGWRLLGVIADEGVSGGLPWHDRPGLERAVLFCGQRARQRAGKTGKLPKSVRSQNAIFQDGNPDGLVVAKLDRLTRSLEDFALLAGLAKREDWALVCLDPDFDMSDPNSKAFVGMLAIFAEWERDMISQRTRTALAVKKARGEKLGRPTEVAPHVEAEIGRLALEEKRSLRYIKARLDLEMTDVTHGFTWKPPRGTFWSVETIRRVVRDRKALASKAG